MNVRSLLAALGVSCVIASTSVAQADGQQSELGKLDALFQKFMTDNHVPGLVYGVVSDGKLLLLRAFGIRDVKSNAPVQDDTAFRIASMSKQFTALATLRLRDAGKLSLDAPAENKMDLKAIYKLPSTVDKPEGLVMAGAIPIVAIDQPQAGETLFSLEKMP